MISTDRQCYIVLVADLHSATEISSWYHHVVGPSMLRYTSEFIVDGLPVDLPGESREFLSGLLFKALKERPLTLPDPTSFDGILTESGDLSLSNLPYRKKIPYKMQRFELRSTAVDAHVPVGFWRSIGHSHTAFAVESFINELSHHAGVDGYQFRMNLLPETPDFFRFRRVLQTVAQRSGWARTQGPGLYRGIAQHHCFGSYTAMVVEIQKDQDAFRVARVCCAVDCGQVLDPGNLTAQAEGAIIFGLTAAMKQKISFKNGVVEQSNFHDSDLLRIHECPAIEIYIVGGEDSPTGIGETCVPAVAPALAHALVLATGRQGSYRSLPLSMEF